MRVNGNYLLVRVRETECEKRERAGKEKRE
jgi:hypothetical protein